jgi:hypothetical protein
MRAVLDLDPFAAAPGAIAAIASLGDDPFKPHDTCLPEDDRAVCIRDVLRQAEAVLATIQKLSQQGASRVPALRAQIAAVQSTSKAYKNTSGESFRLNTARMRSKSETPSGPQITPSPSA